LNDPRPGKRKGTPIAIKKHRKRDLADDPDATSDTPTQPMLHTPIAQRAPGFARSGGRLLKADPLPCHLPLDKADLSLDPVSAANAIDQAYRRKTTLHWPVSDLPTDAGDVRSRNLTGSRM